MKKFIAIAAVATLTACNSGTTEPVLNEGIPTCPTVDTVKVDTVIKADTTTATTTVAVDSATAVK